MNKIMEIRKCATCKKELSVDNFSINPKSGELYKDCNNCKERGKSYREANKEKIAENRKSYYEANKEKILEKHKSYYEANKEKIIKRVAEYREANKEKIAEKDKSYYEANKEKILENKKSYREANKEKIAELGKAYRESNKEKIAEKDKSYYEANKEKIAEKHKAYREANKEKIAENRKSYRNKFAMYNSWKDSFHKNDCKEGKNGTLLVKCKYCNNWFSPSNNEVQHYNSYGIGLYCSKGCKKSCPSFNAPNGIEKKPRQNTSREVQPELRKLVLERDNWTCQKCGANKNDDITVTLHCHHIDPVKNNPIESADMDNCVTLCKACHKEVHKQKGCRYSDLANCKIED